MDKYLISILKEVNTIIIPGIGALTIVNQETGEVMFMSYMKFDDEKLANHIAEKENWDLNEAKNLVSKYVRDINTKLDQGDSYDIYQFGSFKKGTDGEIEFTPWDGFSNASSDTVVAENNVEEDVEELKQEETNPIQEKLEEVQAEADEAVVELKEEVEEIKAEEDDHSIDAVIDLVEEVVTPGEEEKKIVEEKSVPPIVPISEEEQWKDDLDVPPINLKKEIKKKPILEKAEKDKKKKKRGVGFYLLLALLVIIIGGGTFFAINYNDLKEHIPFLASQTKEEIEQPEKEEIDATPSGDQEEEVISEEPSEELIEETPEQTEIIEEVTPEPIAVSSANGLTVNQSLPIQIIVGSFTEESNAERKIAQLKTAGVNAENIGRYDGLHLVSIGSFNSMSDVKANSETIKSAAGTYWVFKK